MYGCQTPVKFFMKPLQVSNLFELRERVKYVVRSTGYPNINRPERV